MAFPTLIARPMVTAAFFAALLHTFTAVSHAQIPYLAGSPTPSAGPADTSGWTLEWPGNSVPAPIGPTMNTFNYFYNSGANMNSFLVSPPSWVGDHSAAMGGFIRLLCCENNGGTLSTDPYPFEVHMVGGAEGGGSQTLVWTSTYFYAGAMSYLGGDALNICPQLKGGVEAGGDGWRVGSASGPVATDAQVLAALTAFERIRIKMFYAPFNGRRIFGPIAIYSEPLQASATFDTGTQGWTADQDGLAPTWVAEGSGGVLESREVQSGTYRNLVPPTSFLAALGSHGSGGGSTLMFRMRATANESDFEQPLIEIDAGEILGKLRYNTTQRPGTDWTLFSLPLTPSGGWTWSNNVGIDEATQARIDGVLYGAKWMRIRAEFSTTDDVCQIDNVSFVTAYSGSLGCGPADIAGAAASVGHDFALDNNDFILFIDLFFSLNPAADRGAAGGVPGNDGQFDNNDFIVFIGQFFEGC